MLYTRKYKNYIHTFSFIFTHTHNHWFVGNIILSFQMIDDTGHFNTHVILRRVFIAVTFVSLVSEDEIFYSRLRGQDNDDQRNAREASFTWLYHKFYQITQVKKETTFFLPLFFLFFLSFTLFTLLALFVHLANT